MRHVIAIFLQNEAGALGRVTNLFATRGFNIESLAVAPTPDPTVSRLTLVTTGDDGVIGQVVSQLGKLLDVIEVIDLSQNADTEFEMALVSVLVDSRDVAQLEKWVAEVDGRVIQQQDNQMIITVTAHPREMDQYIAKLVQQADVIDIARSGVLALSQTPTVKFNRS
jgi:acetolactate synthase-1/3 small subunit